MGNIRKVVLMANNYDALGGITTFVNTISHGFEAANFEVEIVTVEPTRSNGAVLFDSSFKHMSSLTMPLPQNRHYRTRYDRFNPKIR